MLLIFVMQMGSGGLTEISQRVKDRPNPVPRVRPRPIVPIYSATHTVELQRFRWSDVTNASGSLALLGM